MEIPLFQEVHFKVLKPHIILVVVSYFLQLFTNEQEFFISITTDNFPTETSWQLVDQNGGGWFINPGDLTQSNTTYTWSICVPDTNCYTFTILDTYGDGICCGWGSGSYFVNYGGSQIVSGGSFLSSENYFINWFMFYFQL